MLKGVSPKMLSGVIWSILYDAFMNIVCVRYTQKQYGDSFSAIDDFMSYCLNKINIDAAINMQAGS